MDWIIVVLIFIGIFSRSNKKKKQAEQRRNQAWQEAAAAMNRQEPARGHIPPKVRAEISQFVKEISADVIEDGIPTIREAVQDIRGTLPSKKPPRPVMPKKAAAQPEAPKAGSMHYAPADYSPWRPSGLKPPASRARPMPNTPPMSIASAQMNSSPRPRRPARRSCAA